MESNVTNKIIRIERKKSLSFKNRISEQIYKTQIKLVEKHYKEQKLLWRVIYDRLYRLDLYEYVLNCEDKNLNIARNIFNINEEKYKYQKINEDLFLEEGNDLYTENSLLIKYQKYYTLEKIASYLMIPNIIFFSFSIVRRSRGLIYGFAILLFSNLVFNGYIHSMRSNLSNSKIEKDLKKKYKNEVKRYRLFFYDN